MVQQTLSLQRFLRPVDMSNILWAFAVLKVKPAAVLVAVLTQKAIRWRGLYSAPDIASTLWAYAELDLAPSPRIIIKAMQVRFLGHDRAKRLTCQFGRGDTPHTPHPTPLTP